jgi:hypothetical protein
MQQRNIFKCLNKNNQMKLLQILSALTILSICSCKKSSPETQNILGNWDWTATFTNNPAYSATPQSTGLNENIYFAINNTYSENRRRFNGTIAQDFHVINAGTYRLSSAINTNGATVLSIFYSNSRVTDSVEYYVLENKNNLILSKDLIGTVGSGSKHYSRIN